MKRFVLDLLMLGWTTFTVCNDAFLYVFEGHFSGLFIMVLQFVLASLFVRFALYDARRRSLIVRVS